MHSGALQLSLFDQRDMAAITSPDFPGERLIVCRNPDLAAERSRKRAELLAATERDLARIQTAVARRRDPLRGTAAIALAVGKVINKHKMAKHFELDITDAAFSFVRKTIEIAAEAATDGVYVNCTSSAGRDLRRCDEPCAAIVTRPRGSAPPQNFLHQDRSICTCGRSITDWPIAIRAHIFLCMLAYYLEWHMRQPLAPMLFDDHDKAAAEARRSSVVATAQRFTGPLSPSRSPA